MKSKLAFVRQPDSIPKKTAFSLRCFAAILLRLPPKTEAHSTPFQGGRAKPNTIPDRSSRAILLGGLFCLGGDAYSVSAFQKSPSSSAAKGSPLLPGPLTRAANGCSASTTRKRNSTTRRKSLSTPRSCCRPMRRPDMQTGQRSGTP